LFFWMQSLFCCTVFLIHGVQQWKLLLLCHLAIFTYPTFWKMCPLQKLKYVQLTMYFYLMTLV
jgi:hypothetical protein